MTTERAAKLIEHNSLQIQLFMRSVTSGSLVERDRLMEYSVGSYYNELNLFILANKKSKK